MSANKDTLYKPVEHDNLVILAIRVPPKSKEAFTNLCKKHGTNPSEVLRNFIEQELEAEGLTDTVRPD